MYGRRFSPQQETQGIKMDSRQSLSPSKMSDEGERPESPLTGLEVDMAKLSLKAENEELKEKLQELQTELLDEKSNEQYLRREQLVETKQVREEERKHAQAMVSEVRRKLYKEKQQEVHELRERLQKEKEKEIAYVVKQKDEEFRKAQLNWNREKDDLVQKLRVQFTNEIREEVQKSYKKQIRKFEVLVEELKEQKKRAEESCKLAQDADKKKVDQIRRMHLEHEQELTKLKRSSWQEGRKQMAEIRQLTNIIHQLEKKLGVESGHYIRLQLEKDSLRDKLDRIKGNDISGRKSPSSTSRTDLSSDLSMFSFPSVDDSNPLWLQIKQQKSVIAQLKQNIQDKNRRIDLLKQKLFKNQRFGGVMHRSMDDILSYESSVAAERDDCISPLFGYSTGSSDASSLNEESFQGDDNQDVEIIRRLQKEILQLQRAHSLLQAQTESSVDAKRSLMEREQLQTDLIEAQRQIDELNKDLVESHDRNELLEFQLQESLQRNVVEGNCVSMFKIPTLCIDYQFSEEELLCSTEEVKARLEELESEKRPVLNRDEQLTLQQAKRLLENISSGKGHDTRVLISEEIDTKSGASQKDFLELPVFEDSSHDESFWEETDEYQYVTKTTSTEEGFLKRTDVQPAVESDSNQEKFFEILESNNHKIALEESVQLRDVGVQTEHYESPRDYLRMNCNNLEPSNDLSVEKIDTGVQFSTYNRNQVIEKSCQCNILDLTTTNGATIIKLHDDILDTLEFKKVMQSNDIGTQFVSTRVDSVVQCNILDILTNEQEIIEIFNEFDTFSFKKIPLSSDTDVHADMQEYDVIGNDAMVGNVIGKNQPEIDEDGVREKHDGEPSEKTLMKLGWKDFVDCAELDDDAKLLDCLVYEKEDVFIVICESYRKYCKEISRNDYTFDFDDIDVDDKFQETCSVLEEHKDNHLSTVEERNVEKCDVAIQCEIKEGACGSNVEQNAIVCTQCMKLLSASPGSDMYIVNDTGKEYSFPGSVDKSMLNTREDELTTEISDEYEVELIEESVVPEGSEFAFREMSDFGVQCDLYASLDLSSRDVLCLCCGHSKSMSSDVGVQCDFADILSCSSRMFDLSCMSEIPKVLQENEGESLIKEVMALAKECSQNDALIDQHLSEVVRGQELFNQIHDENGDHDDEKEIKSDKDIELPRTEGIEQFETEEKEGDLVKPEEAGTISGSDVPLEILPYSLRCDKETQCIVGDIPNQCQKTLLVTSSTQYTLEDLGLSSAEQTSFAVHDVDIVESVATQSRKTNVDVGTQYVWEESMSSSQIDDNKCDSLSVKSDEWPTLPDEFLEEPLNPEKDISGDEAFEGNNQDINDVDIQGVEGTDIPEQSRDLYSEIPNSELRALSEEDEIIARDFDTSSEQYQRLNKVISENEMPNFHWKDVRDVETQCGEDELLEREDKAIQCTLLDDGQRFGIEGISSEEEGQDENHKFEQRDSSITEGKDVPYSGAIHTSHPQHVGFETPEMPKNSNDGELRVIVENTKTTSALNIDLDNVFEEMEAQPGNAIIPVTLTPLEIAAPAISEESPTLAQQSDTVSRYLAEESTITRSSKADTLHVLDATLEAFVTDGSKNERHEEEESACVSEMYLGVGEKNIGSYNEDMKLSHNVENAGQSFSEDTSSPETSSQVTVENYEDRQSTSRQPLSPLPIPEGPPPFQDNHPPTTAPSSSDTYFPKPDSPPPLPDTLPPTLPTVSPPSVMHSDLDDDIEAFLAGELDQDSRDLTHIGVKRSVGIRSTLEHEIQAILGSEDSSVNSEPNTVLSIDSLHMNQTATVSNTELVGSHAINNSSCYENEDDETEMTSSFDDDYVNSGNIDDVTSITNDDLVSETNNDVIFESNDRLLYANVEGLASDAHAKSMRKSRHDDSQMIESVGTKSSPANKSLGKNFVFQSEISEDSVTESSSVGEGGHRRQPPPVLPKPKCRSSSLNLPVSEFHPFPTQDEKANSFAARRDMMDGCFPPAGLVPKRASEFNLGEFDLLKERIVYLERQLKNKENLLQSMRAEATEIETNAYIQKKEEDIKIMDESVRFLKIENQKKEKELITKLEQLKSERANTERQREILEDNVNSLQDRAGRLETVQAQYQELRCKYESLVNENTQLNEQVGRLHRADEEFVELERTISKLQAKLKELEDVKRERDELSEQLKALTSQKDDLAQKGRKIETERNDFLMNNKLIEQQKENLVARNNALQRTNDTFKTKISSLEKECRDAQRRLFDIQRDRDEGSSQLRKVETERNELRKRVNQLIECKSELKQYHSKSHDLERELNYLRTQCKKIDNERSELSTELGNCLKERNKLEGRTAELEKLTRDNEKLEEKFHTLKLKIAELTSQRDDAEVQLPTLKAKVALLKKACKEKDDQLDKLKAEIRELKHSIASSALNDLSSIPSFGFDSPDKAVKFRESSDLNNDATLRDSVKGKQFVVLFDYDPERLSTTGHPQRELKLNEGDVVTVNSDMDLNGYYMAKLDGRRGLVSSLYIEEMDEYDIRRLKKPRESNVSKRPSKKADLQTFPPRSMTNPPGLVKRSFVALQDYNPFTSSTSTRPDLELPLTAGEVVTVVGDVDANGYYTVEKGGRLAIIPSNLVKPNSPSLTRPNKLNFTAPLHTSERDASTRFQDKSRAQGSFTPNAFSGHYPSHSTVVPRQSTVIHAAPPGSTPYATREVSEHFVRQSSVENILNAQNTFTDGASGGIAERKAAKVLSVLPSAPRNLRVLRCVNKDSLLLGWVAPEVDELGRNNGQLIRGYKIFANGQSKLDVDSPYMAKALIENLDLTRPVDLAIQTVADNGFCSEKSLTHFNEAVMMETTSVTTEDVSHLDSNRPYRTFVALFSYDPLKSSPNSNPTFELEFQEGDIIRVLDTSRPDGYYTGQVNGTVGLVPSNFIEEIAVATRPGDRKRDKDIHGSNASLRSASSLSPKRTKAMVALYDYNPTTQSPNKHPDRELSFRKGQIIRVLGSMRSDGFYEADINGQKGLVPSSFLKPCKRNSTKSVQSTNGFASLPRRVQFAHEQDIRHATAGYV